MSRFMAIVATTLVVVAVAFAILRSRPGDLPIQGEVPAFSLTDASGAPFNKDRLDRRVWIADFIFTQCPGMCPLMSGQMQRVQAELERRGIGDVSLVSFSVDPKNDTPEALRAYAQRFSADPKRWTFLTGERQALYDLVSQGFNLAVAERDSDPDGEGLITHSDRFVLVDQQSRIRGYYHGTEAESVNQLIDDLDKLR